MPDANLNPLITLAIIRKLTTVGGRTDDENLTRGMLPLDRVQLLKSAATFARLGRHRRLSTLKLRKLGRSLERFDIAAQAATY